MTQRIFDTDNEEDMKLLWSILPESVVKIKDGTTDEGGILNLFYGSDYCKGGCGFININWHDKTEIARTVNYEDMIGCVGWFGSKSIKTTLSILKSVDCTYGNPWFECKDGKHWEDFTPAKKSELKFWGE